MYANKQVLDEEELIALDEFAKLEARLEKKKTAKDDKEWVDFTYRSINGLELTYSMSQYMSH